MAYMFCLNLFCVLILSRMSLVVAHVYCYYVCFIILDTLFAGLLARNRYPEGPATGHLGTGFAWVPCVCL